MTRRILFTLLVLAFPVPLLAQNDFGIWINSTQFRSTTERDLGIPGVTAELKFDQKVGYGLSFNHFSGPNFSTEFAAQQVRGKAKLDVRSTTPVFDETLDIGDLQTNVLSAIVKWHFAPRSFISPYLGAGVAYFTGGRLNIDADPLIGLEAETVRFENKFNFAANAGINFAVTSRMSVALDGRYAPYEARDKNDPDPATGSVKLDPTIVSLGLRFRM